mgnify:CR=1 FL=1
MLYFQVEASENYIVTEEYKELKREAISMLWKTYEECVHKDDYEVYKKTYEECLAEGKRKNIGGGCAHIAQFATAKNIDKIPDTTHCKKLKPNTKRINELTDRLAKERNIEKRKKNILRETGFDGGRL